jgi:NADH-ubiquinone oxidoreductase chain 5
MSAPTPIRALVHRRTLVTAGLVLLFNFSLFLFSGEILIVLFMVGLFTSLFSSLRGIFEEDLKKVVALSTLSQIGFSFLGLGLGLYFLSFIHLISHALFKSTLFLQVGFIIHNSFRQQDGRNYRNLGFFVYFFQVQLLVTLLCLCGLLFSSGYVTKEILIFFLFKFNFYIFIFFFFYLIIFLTFIYRFRL